MYPTATLLLPQLMELVVENLGERSIRRYSHVHILCCASRLQLLLVDEKVME